MAKLIPAPILDVRSGELLAAQAIARVSGGHTVALIDRYMEILRELRALVVAGGLAPPICPELVNANPSSPHTVPLEAFAWLVEQIAYRINQVPDQNRIEFARLFRIELREAERATALLEFTVAPPLNTQVVIPAGTRVATVDGEAVFETTAEKVIPYGSADLAVEARRMVEGRTLLTPGVLVDLLDIPAFVTGVTNPTAVESGSDAETVASALERARNYQRRSERIVNGRDLEDAIREDVLFGNGIVKVWPFVKDGDWETPQAGHTTVVVMTSAGAPLGDELKAAIRLKLGEMVGAQFVYLKDPTFVDFNVSANVKLRAGLVTQNAVMADAERRLRDFYSAADPGNFGRTISRSEVIAVIEGTDGVDRIEPQPGGAILAAPADDVDIAPYEMPRLVDVTLNAVP